MSVREVSFGGLRRLDSVSPALLVQYQTVRAATETLCEPLELEDYVVQSMPDASPAKWHLAHTTWFFEEFLLRRLCTSYRSPDDRFRFLFNSYYQAVGPMHERPRRGLLSRPTVDEVLAYRMHVDARMQELIERAELSDEDRAIIALGLHHEQQHQELLLTDIKHLFSCNPLEPAYARPKRAGPAAPCRIAFHDFDGGLVEIGAGAEGFAFDNERPRHKTFVQPFAIADRPATNAEFLEFVRDGSYSRPELWLSEGWDWVQREGLRHPLYWADTLDSEFTLTGRRALAPHEPACHLSFYEADAFARWCGARLPLEAEWEIAAANQPVQGNFLEAQRWHPAPAAPATGASTGASLPALRSLSQLFGDVWEWTRSAYAPYPGFRPAAGALGEYNGKFMVNQLVLRGGSCASPRVHVRATYRNFFPASARWQFSGVRLARDRQ